jgi:cell division septum initiation protein DivIVA
MKASRIITAARREKAGACADQVALFRETFGARVAVTVPAMEAVANLFDWEWAAQHLLSAAARAEYARARAPAWAEYERVTAAALAEYERVTAAAWAEYERVRAAAWAEYERVVRARTFGKLYAEGAA